MYVSCIALIWQVGKGVQGYPLSIANWCWMYTDLLLGGMKIMAIRLSISSLGFERDDLSLSS